MEAFDGKAEEYSKALWPTFVISSFKGPYFGIGIHLLMVSDNARWKIGIKIK